MTKRCVANPDKEKLEKALHEIRNKTISIRLAAQKYGIPKSTLHDRIAGRVAEGVVKFGPQSFLREEEEVKITEWILNMLRCSFSLKRKYLLNAVQKIIVDTKRKTPFKNGRPGKTWLGLFFKRHSFLAKKNAENISKRKSSVTEECIRKWFNDFQEYLQSNGLEDVLETPSRLFSGDESGFSMFQKADKNSPKIYRNNNGIKRKTEKETITVLIVISANGEMLPPMVTFPYLRPPKDLIKSMPENWTMGGSESGRMKSEPFFEYVTKGFNNYLNLNRIRRPVVLFLDGNKSHITLELSEFCRKQQIILYALPPNTTHIMQPVDASVFKPLKWNWKQNLYKCEPENIVFTKKHFCPMLEKTLKATKNIGQSIQNGFRESGLFPLNPDAVNYSLCVKTNSTNLKRKQSDEESKTRTKSRNVESQIKPKPNPQISEYVLDSNAIIDVLEKSTSGVQTSASLVSKNESLRKNRSALKKADANNSETGLMIIFEDNLTPLTAVSSDNIYSTIIEPSSDEPTYFTL